jgi:hypothetical protein
MALNLNKDNDENSNPTPEKKGLNLNKDNDEKSNTTPEKKGLNLNKDNDENSNPTPEKKGLNLDKTSDSNKVSLNLTKASDAPAGSPSSSDNKSAVKKKSPMLYILVPVALLVIGLFWYMNSTTPSTVVDPTTVEEPVEAPVEAPVQAPVEAPVQAPVEAPVEEQATPAVEEQAAVTAPVGTIEEKANQVISGDFGNGANRKRALGKDYAKIQAKINEMYRAKN